MSGVRTGTRLEQLLNLRRQLNLEIEVETRRDPVEAVRLGLIKPKWVRPPRRRGGHKRPDMVVRVAELMARLERMGVTQHDVKVWAVEQGLLDEVKRGIVAGRILDAYAEAHP